MTTFVFGTPNLYVKGIAEQKFFDANGNIVAYGKVLSDAAVTTSVNMQEITGYNGTLAGMIPDTSRMTGTYTNQAFSLEERALATGGTVSYLGIHTVCETITATDETLAVTGTPVTAYNQSANDTFGWCYVRTHGANTYMGTNYGIDLQTKKVQNFAAIAGTTYDVIYFTNNASARQLAIPDTFNPAILSVEIKFGVYAMQNANASQGTFYGWLYVNIPRVQLGGDGGGITGSQTANATGALSWTALPSGDNDLICDTCGQIGGKMAYYVVVPCDNASSAVTQLAVIGDGVTVTVNGKTMLPIKYVMPDNSIVQPNYKDMTYESAATGTATVANGEVTGVAVGDTTVTATLTKNDGTALKAVVNVTVTAS